MPITAAAVILIVALAGTIAAFIPINHARHLAEEAQSRTEVELFDSYTTLGINAGEAGNPTLASFWFANAAAVAGGDRQRQEANRVRFRAWSRRMPVPIRAFLHEDVDFKGLWIHPGGEHLMALSSNDHCRVWRIEDESALPLRFRRSKKVRLERHRSQAAVLERQEDFDGALWHLNRLKAMGEPVEGWGLYLRLEDTAGQKLRLKDGDTLEPLR